MSLVFGFGEDNIGDPKVLQVLTNHNPLASLGASELLADPHHPESLKQAIVSLTNRRSERDIQEADVEFGVLADDTIRWATQNSYMDLKKLSLYLYSIQTMRKNLGLVPLKNKQTNTYVSQVFVKFKEARERARHLGIPLERIHDECYTSDYRTDGIPGLEHFEYLDERRVERAIQRLKQPKRYYDDVYRPVGTFNLSAKEAIMAENQVASQAPQYATREQIMALTEAVKKQFAGIDGEISAEKLNADLKGLFQLVQDTLQTEDLVLVKRVAIALRQRVLEKAQKLTITAIREEGRGM